MRILDASGVEYAENDELLKTGRLVQERINTVFHEAVESVEEVGHYETVAEYPNGGKDVEWVVDTPGQIARDAYWETEDILRFVSFTAQELAQRSIAELTAQLRSTDTAVLEEMEGLLACSSLKELLSWLASAASELKDTLENRKSLREQINELMKEGEADETVHTVNNA